MKKIIVASNISRLSQLNFVTGIQRVAVETHLNLKKYLPNFDFFGYIQSGSEKSINYLENPKLASDPILNSESKIIEEIDILLLLDLDSKLDAQLILEQKNKRNLKVISVIHDILPITNNEWFPAETLKKEFLLYLMKLFKISDYIVVTSDFVKGEISKFNWDFKGQFVKIELGAFEQTNYVPNYLRRDKSIIYVSTIEPRKGHDQLLEAFNILIASGENYRLNLVGKNGWKSDDIIEKITQNKEYGKRLRWFDNLNDDELSAMLKNSSVAVQVSRAEGFGLAIEEALYHGLPVIARKIPVFLERKYSDLHFFESTTDLVNQIRLISSSNQKYVSNKVRSMNDFVFELAEIISTIKID